MDNENTNPEKIYLTPEEIDFEIDKIANFFTQVDPVQKSDVARKLIFEIVNQGSYNHYEALGIFEEAKINYRERSIEVMDEFAENDYIRTIKVVGCNKDYPKLGLVEDEVYTVRSIEEDTNYGGGLKIVLVDGKGREKVICKHVLKEYFTILDEEEEEGN